MQGLRSCAIVIALVAAVSVNAGKPAPAPAPPSAIIAGTWTSTGPFPEQFVFLPNQQSFQRSFTVPAGGAWLWGDAKYANYLEMDCAHHYQGDADPALAEYVPLFTAGELPPPYDVCTFGNCYSCRLDWGGVKASSYLTTVSAPAFVPEGSHVITIKTLNGGGNSDNLNLLIEQMNRNDLSSLTMFQAVSDDDPSPASDTEIAARTFVANSGDRVPVVPVFHGATGDFPGGPDITYTATWDNGDVTKGEESVPKVLHGLTVVDVPLPKLTTGNHKFKLNATLPGGKTLTTTEMTVFVYAQTIFLTYGTFNAKTGTDNLPVFIPGADANGNDISLIDGSGNITPQVMQLSIVTGRATGSVTVTVDPTSYPGVAMNYPIPGGGDPDYDLGGGQLSITAPIPKDHVVRLQLYVRDYGGSANISAVVPYRKTTYTATRRVPLDDDRNGLPDAGWYVSGQKISTQGLTAAGDIDNSAPSTVIGDGFSNYEECRGFFVGGVHTRFDPAKKDVVIFADEAILLDWHMKDVLDTLSQSVTIHYVRDDEVSGSNLQRVSKADPTADPNGDGVPGVRPVSTSGNGQSIPPGQRAIRAVCQSTQPPVFTGTNGLDYVVTRLGYGGYTFSNDIADTFHINATANNGSNFDFTDLDGVSFLEVYPGILSLQFHTSDLDAPHYDEFGAEIPGCLDAGVNPDTDRCDEHEPFTNLIRPWPRAISLINVPDNSETLRDGYSFPSAELNDYYSNLEIECNGITKHAATTAEMEDFKKVIIGHEVGHALGIEHEGAPCDDIAGKRAASVWPLPATFKQYDIDRIRLIP